MTSRIRGAELWKFFGSPMDPIQLNLSSEGTDYPVRDLLEQIACKTDDLRKCMEGIQDLAGEMTSDAAVGHHSNSLMRLQILDSLCQRVAVLPELIRSLKTAVPAELRIEDAETLRAFAASMCSYQGAAVSSRPEGSDGVGDFEIWKI